MVQDWYVAVAVFINAECIMHHAFLDVQYSRIPTIIAFGLPVTPSLAFLGALHSVHSIVRVIVQNDPIVIADRRSLAGNVKRLCVSGPSPDLHWHRSQIDPIEHTQNDWSVVY